MRNRTYLACALSVVMLLYAISASASTYYIWSLQNSNVIDNRLNPIDGLVHQWVWDATDGQKWTVSTRMECIKQIYSYPTRKYLDVLNNSNANGTPIFQRDFNDGASQYWWIIPITKVNEVQYFKLLNFASNASSSSKDQCLTLGNDAPWPPYYLVVQQCANAHNQLWAFLDVATGLFSTGCP